MRVEMVSADILCHCWIEHPGRAGLATQRGANLGRRNFLRQIHEQVEAGIVIAGAQFKKPDAGEFGWQQSCGDAAGQSSFGMAEIKAGSPSDDEVAAGEQV